ncbi:hypothetical protein EV368DRAFT_61435 [Lentinula lateritia]|nr:hypothetical protein EV368DRAFT_61435 [Lentinula lateritia]
MVYTPSPATAAFALLTLGALSIVNAAAIPASRGLSGTPVASTGASLTPGIGLAHSSLHMNASESEHHGTTAEPTTPAAPAPDSLPVETPSEIHNPESGDYRKHSGAPEGKHSHGTGNGNGKNLESVSNTMKKGSHRAKSSTSEPISTVDPAVGNASQLSSDMTGSPGSEKGLDGMKQRRSFKSVMSDINTGVKDVGNDVGGLVSAFLKREEFEEV